MFEGLPTLCTLVGTAFGVELLVPVMVGPGGEGLPAQAARIGLLSGVDLPVLVQARAGHMCLPTLAAGVQPALQYGLSGAACSCGCI